jgi:hypothetical protein
MRCTENPEVEGWLNMPLFASTFCRHPVFPRLRLDHGENFGACAANAADLTSGFVAQQLFTYRIEKGPGPARAVAHSMF